MKYFFLMVLLIAGPVLSQSAGKVNKSDPGYNRAIGIGSTFQDAKNNAFKNAVSLLVGSAILSEAELTNDKLTRNDVLEYSAGYIDSYEIVSSTEKSGRFTVVVDVIVRSSKMHERVLNKGRSDKLVDGNHMSTQYDNYRLERASSDKFLSAVLNDFPKRAFEISQGNIELKVDPKRNAFLYIPYEIKWSYKYAMALDEALSKLSTNNRPGISIITVMMKPPENIFLGFSNRHFFNDTVHTDLVSESLDQQLILVANIIDGYRNVIHNERFIVTTSFFGAVTKGSYVLHGNTKEKNYITIPVNVDGNLYNALQNAGRVELSIEARPRR